MACHGELVDHPGDEGGVDLPHDGVAEKLQKPRDADDEGALVLLERPKDGVSVHLSRKYRSAANGNGHHKAAHEGVGMVKGKNNQDTVLGNEHLDVLGTGVGVGVDVAKGEHDALRIAGRPRCVDD